MTMPPIQHGWFASGAYTLLGHIHQPEANAKSIGVVIVPPFGWEDVCSYRPLRELAGRLAANGVSVLRYDLPGTGDSSGNADDPGLFEAWIASIGDAANHLRLSSGVSRIAVLGIGMGATLSLAANARGANLDELILWGGAALGRTLLRELRAFRNLELPENGGSASQPSGDNNLEVGGFYLSASTVAALEALDLSTLPSMPGRRVLTLTRDEFAIDKKLAAALSAAGAIVEQQTGLGYANMMAVPHEASLSEETPQAIVDWLVSVKGESQIPGNTNSCASNEAVALIPHRSGEDFGIVTPAASTNGIWLLFLNPGAGRHTGPNRLWVEAARYWSARGVPSLRFDIAGVGESDGAQNLDVAGLYDDALADQVERAMNFLRDHHNARQFIVIGLCSGAFLSFHAAVRQPAVRAAILINPRLFFWDAEVDRRREKLRNVNAVSNPGAWKRLVRGEVPVERIRSVVRDVLGNIAAADSPEVPETQIPAEAMAAALTRIADQKTRLTMIFTEGEPLLREMEDEGFLTPDAPFRCLRIANAGHTFRPLWAQRELRKMIDAEIEATLASLRS